MSLEPKSKVEEVNTVLPWKSRSTLSVLHLPRNVYLLLFFTLGKGFQFPIPVPPLLHPHAIKCLRTAIRNSLAERLVEEIEAVHANYRPARSQRKLSERTLCERSFSPFIFDQVLTHTPSALSTVRKS